MDLAGFGKAELGDTGTDQFVDQRTAQDNGTNGRGVLRNRRFGNQGKTDGNTGLRHQGKAQIILDGFRSVADLSGEPGPEVFTNHSENDVNDTDDSDRREHGQFQIGAGGREEQHIKGRSEIICNSTDVLRIGIGTEVAENCSESHAQKQGRNVQKLCDSGTEENKSDDQGKTVAGLFEELQRNGKDQAHGSADTQSSEDLQDRLQDGLGHGDGMSFQGVCDGDGNTEVDQGGRIIDGDNGKQGFGHGALSFVLFDDHDGRGRSGCGGNGTQGQGERHGIAGDDQTYNNKDNRKQGFEDGNNDRCCPDPFKIGDLEFVADGEGNESQGYVGNDAETVKCSLGNDVQYTGADQKAGDQVAGDIG